MTKILLMASLTALSVYGWMISKGDPQILLQKIVILQKKFEQVRSIRRETRVSQAVPRAPRMINAGSPAFSNLSYLEVRKLWDKAHRARRNDLVEGEFGDSYQERLHEKSTFQYPDENDSAKRIELIDKIMSARTLPYFLKGRCFVTRARIPNAADGFEMTFMLSFGYEKREGAETDPNKPTRVQVAYSVGQDYGSNSDLGYSRQMNRSGKEYLIFDLTHMRSHVSFVALEVPDPNFSEAQLLYAGPKDRTWKSVTTPSWARKASDFEVTQEPIDWDDPCYRPGRSPSKL